jgi:hypothetical protein
MSMTLDEKIAVLQAAKEGKTIQRRLTEIGRAEHIFYNSATTAYQKQLLLEKQVVSPGDGHFVWTGICNCGNAAPTVWSYKISPCGTGCDVFHVREVIEGAE